MKNWLKSTFGRFILVSLSLSLVFSFLLNFHTQGNFDLINSLYWWVSVTTTVGVADLAVIDNTSKVLAALSMFFGAILYFAIISELVLFTKRKSDQRVKGYKKYKGTNHVIIAGYNTMAYGLIHLIDKLVYSEIDIVLITEKLDSNPFPERVKFVKSSPNSMNNLEAVSIGSASICFTLSDDTEAPKKADVNTLLTGGIIEDIAPNVYTIVEINSETTKSKELSAFNIDQTISYKTILEAIKDNSKSNQLLKNIPSQIREKIIKEEYR